MDTSTSSQGSYVLVHPPAHSLHQLHPYLPLLAQPLRFTDHQQQLEQVTLSREQQPDHNLFIDHLLALALPPGSYSYPPASHAELTALVSTLLTSPLNALTARSILFYLALSLSTPQLALSLARDHLLLPAAFRLSIRAFHALDHADYERGVKLLADPRVTPDFVPRTFAVLGSLPEPKERAQLVLSYWRLAGVRLEDHGKEEAKVVLRALCAEGRRSGANEAWVLAREWHVEEEREELAMTVLAVCFGDNPTRLPLPQHLSTLLARPFTPTEDALTTSFCSSPPSSLNATLTADWRLSKLIAESRPVDALRFWAAVQKRNSNTGGAGKMRVEPSDQRDRLLAAVEANLTAVQKTTLSLEIASSPAPAPAPAAAPSAAPAVNITQPAWAPSSSSAVAAFTAAQPAAAPLPRTLAAARLAQLPPPPAPAPKQADLPLSASPFVRGGGPNAGAAGAGGVLKALEAATPRKGATAGNSAGFTPHGHGHGSPFAFPPPSTAGSTVAPSTIGGGTVVEYPLPTMASPAATKPTLAGFGSVRQQPLAPPSPQVQAQATPKAKTSLSSRRYIEQQHQQDEDEDEDGDAAMAVDNAEPVVAEEEHRPEEEEEQEQDYAFAARAALDPAIAATIAAAESGGRTPAPEKTPAKPKRTAGAASARSTRTRERGDKRRAVSAEPEGEGAAESKTPGKGKGRTSGRRATSTANAATRGRDRPDEGRTVKLPPGAFPGQDEDEEEDEQEEHSTSTSTRRSSSRAPSHSQAQKTPARRSARTSNSRQSTVDPPSPAESTTSTVVGRATRRSTRASSVALSEAGDEGEEEEGAGAGAGRPKRRSSRLSTSASEVKTPARGTRRSTRRGGGGVIEEEE
ncbi:hypothetical protein JCM6882_003406 [Rhodosporidiobolus microsporus]